MPFAAGVTRPLNRGKKTSVSSGGRIDLNRTRCFTLKVDCVGTTEVIGRISADIAAADMLIEETEYHADLANGRIFIRMILHDASGISNLAPVRRNFAAIAAGLGADTRWRICETEQKPRIVILVSGEMHCLLDVLDRTHDGTLQATVVGVIGNHLTAAAAVDGRNVPFDYVQFPARDAQDRMVRRAEAFERIEQIVDAHDPDVIVLARFMQILPSDLCARWAGRAINIHHSILPAFAGGSPYHQAHSRGVKVVGATCHYVTSDLDAGPIIEQDVIRVNHADTVADMICRGREVECAVLGRGLQWHVEDRVFINGDSTVVLAQSASNRTRSA